MPTSHTKHKGHGLIVDVVKPEDYRLGDGQLPAVVLQPSGHGWGPFLPADQFQNINGLETENCTSYGTLHAIATLMKRLYPTNGGTFDYSERYCGITAATTPTGNSPQTVIEKIRTSAGVIPYSLLPFDSSIQTWEEYYSPNPMTPDLLGVGAAFLKDHTVGHEWVITPGIPLALAQQVAALKTALQFSPVGIGVYAWENVGDIYIRNSNPDDHWVTLYDYVDGQYWMVFDSYDSTHKKLGWDFQFSMAKRYHIEAIAAPTPVPPQPPVDTTVPPPPSPIIPAGSNWFIELLKALGEFFKDIFSNTNPQTS